MVATLLVSLSAVSVVAADKMLHAADLFQLEKMTTSVVTTDYGKGLALKAAYLDGTATLSNALGGDLKVEFSLNKENIARLKAVSFVLTSTINEESVTVRLDTGSASSVIRTIIDGSESAYCTVENTPCFALRYSADQQTMTLSNGTELLWESKVSEKEFNGANPYRLSIVLENRNQTITKKYTSVVLYSINDQRIDDYVLADSAAPILSANVEFVSVVGQKYTIPAPYAYDMVSGLLDEVTVSISSGDTIVLPEQIYYDGMTVSLSKGDYVITYSAKDSFGRVTTKNYPLKSVLASDIEEDTYVFTGSFQNQILGVGSSCVLPQVTMTSQRNIKGRALNTTLSVYKDGNLIAGYNNQSDYAGDIFSFDSEGVYTFVFAPVGDDMTENYTATITVAKELPSMSLTEEIPAVFKQGSSVSFPKVDAKLNGKVFTCEQILYIPDGSAQKLDGPVTLDLNGIYILEYKVVVNGQVYGLKKSFLVQGTDVTLTGQASAEMTEAGIDITLRYQSDSFQYDRLLNVNTPGNLAQIQVIPSTSGYCDFYTLYVDLVDVNDPENYLSIRFNCTEADKNLYRVYVSAAVPSLGHLYSGLENGMLHRGGSFGTMTYIDFSNPNSGDLAFRYDSETKCVYVAPTDGVANLLVVDLDEFAYFDRLWDGFSSDQVYLRISAGAFSMQSGNCLLKSVNGVSVNSAVSKIQPQMWIQYGQYTSTTLPAGVVGKPYPLPNATAMDAYGNMLNVDKKVYFFGNKNLEFVVYQDQFVPTLSGTYVATYIATDKYGNIATEEVWFQIDASAPELSANLEMNLTTLPLGKTTVLPNGTSTGGVGYAVQTITATNLSDNISEVLTNNEFCPEKSGTYRLTWIFTDYIGNRVTIEKQVVVEAQGIPVLDGEAKLPAVMINGQTYRIPVLTAFCYNASNDKETVPVTIVVTDNQGEHTITDGKYVPQLSGNGTITVEYIAEKNGQKTTKKYTVPVQKATDDSGNLLYGEYFLKDGIQSWSTQQSAISFRMSDGAKITFTKPVLAADFLTSFRLDSSASGKLIVTMVDSENPDVAVSFTFVKSEEDTTKVFVNGSNRSFLVAGDLFDGDTLQVGYKQANHSYVSAGVQHALVQTLDGEVFEGFPSGRVIVSYQVEGAATLQLVRINNQLFNNITNVDRTSAEIAIVGKYGGNYDKGKEILLPKAITEDVLSTISNIKMTVNIVGGGIAKSIDGVELKDVDPSMDWVIKPETYGSYSVTLTATDGAGNVSSKMYMINVYDATPPEVQFTGWYIENVKLGSKVKIRSIKVSDESECETHLMVRLPNGTLSYIRGSSFTASVAGRYEIICAAYDASGNMTTTSYFVNVG